MEILRTISFYCEAKGLKFLVTGGHAVNAYGISRQTGDLDLIVKRSDKGAWQILLEKLRYTPFQDDERFSRFKPAELASWPIDLMYLDDQSFDKMLVAAQEINMGTVNVPVVSAEHLVALKIHTLKYYQAHREPKDYGDLLALLRTAAAKLSEVELRALCEKYASIELFERLAKDLDINRD